MSARPAWIAVLAGVAIVAYITFNTLSTPGVGSTGPAAGDRLPPFAAPLVTSDLVGDANVATVRNHGNAAGAVPACTVHDPRALNVCTLERSGPVVLAFLTGSKRCVTELDAMQAIASRYPQVGFAAVAVRGDRGDLLKLVREHGWRFPVAEDRDGAVANLYGVAVCPTVVLAYSGGKVMRTALGDEVATPQALERSVRRLVAALPGPGAAGPPR